MTGTSEKFSEYQMKEGEIKEDKDCHNSDSTGRLLQGAETVRATLFGFDGSKRHL
jgi:hypothetical protein